MWKLLYRPDLLASIASRIKTERALWAFGVGAGIPAAMVFAIGGAAVGEPYRTFTEYYETILTGLLIIGPLMAISIVGLPTVLLWSLARSNSIRTAAAARVLLLSPLVVFVPLFIINVFGSFAAVTDRDFGMGEPIPSWMNTSLVQTIGSGAALLATALFWMAAVGIALFHVTKGYPLNQDLWGDREVQQSATISEMSTIRSQRYPLWRLLYRPDLLADAAARTSPLRAVLAFLASAGTPYALIFTARFAYLQEQLWVLAPINFLTEAGAPLLAFWVLSLNKSRWVATFGRALLLSPLAMCVPLVAWTVLSVLLKAPGNPGGGLAFFNSSVVLLGSYYALLGFSFIWIGIVGIALWRIREFHGMEGNRSVDALN